MEEEDIKDVEAMIRLYEDFFPPHERGNILYREKIEKLRLVGVDPGMPHVRAAPLFELFSVSIQSGDKLVADGKPCRIYGFIVAFDEDGNTYFLYNRKRSNPEKLLLRDKLALDGYPICPSKPLRLAIYLRDAVRKVQIANGSFSLDCKRKCDYDFRKVERVNGDCGYAVVKHCTFMSAFIGHVEVQITKSKDDGNNFIDVYGSISAHFGENYSKEAGDGMEKHYFLFRRMPEESQRVRSGEVIELSRYVVAVPAYSTVSIVLDLWEAQTGCRLAKATVDFDASERGTDSNGITAENYNVDVEVKWRHPDDVYDNEINKLRVAPIEDLGSSLPSSISSLYKSIASSVEEGQGQRERGVHEHMQFERSLLLAHQLSPLDSGICRPPLTWDKHPFGVPLVEVFSVFVDCDKQDDGVGIHGNIRLHDKLGTTFIFERDDMHPEIMSQTCKVVSIQGPSRSFVCEKFRMDVKLKDVQGRVVIKGYMEWRNKMHVKKGYISWFDRRIRSIIKGENGYAAVHYTIFSSGVQAVLKVLLSSTSNNNSAKVYGNIIAQYNNFDYSTYYASEFYQNVLFQEPLEKPLHLDCSSEVALPLSKCVISAPSDCSLIIKLDLTVLPNIISSDEDINVGVESGVILQHVLDFKAFCNDFRRIQTSNGYCVTVSAEWTPVVDN